MFSPPLKILLIDDNPADIRLIKELLAVGKGFLAYETIEANNGEEGIRLAEQENPDLVLLDVMMPGLDGIETARQLKQNEVTKKIPIIMLTGTIDPSTIERCHDIGVSDYIAKAFEPKVLFEKIRKILSAKGGE